MESKPTTEVKEVEAKEETKEAESESGLQRYTLEEAAQHTDEDDCWVVVYDKVYDVTDFLYDHPGGPPVLLAIAGKDGTKEFEK